MAAFDFPNSPSVNDQYTANGVTFKWNGTIWQRISASSGAQGTTGSAGPTGAQGAAAGLTISTSAPGSPSAGDMWWDSDAGLFLTYYNDGNSSQWVEINQGPKGAQGATGPTGAQGATGSTGAQGAAGAQGATGAAGSNATISNNADNRVITGGSGTNLNGEASLTFSSGLLKIDDHAGNAGNGRLEFGNSGEQFIEGYDTGNAGSSSFLKFGDGSTERLRITSNGTVIVKTNGINLENATATNSRGYSITNAAGTTGWTFGNGIIASSHQFVIYDNTAGAARVKIDSSGHVSITSGNLEFASGSGIDFSANSDGGRSIDTDGNKFDEYEEGTWTPTDVSGQGITITSSNPAKYTKIGRLVHCTFDCTWAGGHSGGGNAAISSPFAMGEEYGSGAIGWNQVDKPLQTHVNSGGIQIMENYSNGSGSRHLSNNSASGKRIIGEATYFTGT